MSIFFPNKTEEEKILFKERFIGFLLGILFMFIALGIPLIITIFKNNP